MHDTLAVRQENIALKKQVIQLQFALLQFNTQAVKQEEAELQADIAAAKAAEQQPVSYEGTDAVGQGQG